jgi:hypothetical protein
MSDSQRLHASLLSVLQPSLMQEDFRNVDTLAWAMTGVLMQKTVNLPAWAVIVPDQSEAKAREVRFRRWLQNPKLDAQSWYTPFITGALTDWKKSTVHIALDATRVNNRLVIVRTALIYRQRAVPLAWRVFQRQSVMLAFEHYAPVLRYTATLLPPDATVILLGDRGFRDIQLMQLARELKWHFRLRLAENEYFSTAPIDHRPCPAGNSARRVDCHARPPLPANSYRPSGQPPGESDSSGRLCRAPDTGWLATRQRSAPARDRYWADAGCGNCRTIRPVE